MRKKILSLALALALCLGLTAPVFAAEAKPGDTTVTVTDSTGYTHTLKLSNPIVKVDTIDYEDGTTVYLVPEGTVITPVLPDGATDESEVMQVDGEDWVSMIRFQDETYTYKFLVNSLSFGTDPDDPERGDIWIWWPSQGVNFIDGLQLSYSVNEVECRREWAVTGISGIGGTETASAKVYFQTVKTDETSSPAESNAAFTDVPAGEYYAGPVAWAVEKGITNGTSKTTFSPDQTCTQSQILTFLWRSQGEPKPAAAVSSTDYYASAAQWAREQGLTDNFSADAPCTRAMVVTYLWKLAGKPSAAAVNFSDISANADYAQAVSWAVAQGITNGTSTKNNTFSPDATCTRGQIVTFLYRAFA